MQLGLHHWILGLAATALLSACGSDSAGGSCAAAQQNLLQDPQFATLTGSRRDWLWSISAHADVRSFEYQVENGVLSITKTGTEPWALVSQSVQDPNLGGKTVRYSAEIQPDLQPPEPMHGFEQGGGLSLTARARGKIVARSILENEPRMGSHDWTGVAVELALPANTDSVQVGFLHQANGAIAARNPSLVVTSCAD